MNYHAPLRVVSERISYSTNCIVLAKYMNMAEGKSAGKPNVLLTVVWQLINEKWAISLSLLIALTTLREQ